MFLFYIVAVGLRDIRGQQYVVICQSKAAQTRHFAAETFTNDQTYSEMVLLREGGRIVTQVTSRHATIRARVCALQILLALCFCCTQHIVAPTHSLPPGSNQ